jgi:hypothetical protein
LYIKTGRACIIRAHRSGPQAARSRAAPLSAILPGHIGILDYLALYEPAARPGILQHPGNVIIRLPGHMLNSLGSLTG